MSFTPVDPKAYQLDCLDNLILKMFSEEQTWDAKFLVDQGFIYLFDLFMI